jgi:hypothetical protein
MPTEIFHRGYKIEADSYQNESAKWVPCSKITAVDESPEEPISPLSWQREFETQQEADDFAISGAQLYIDEEY